MAFAYKVVLREAGRYFSAVETHPGARVEYFTEHMVGARLQGTGLLVFRRKSDAVLFAKAEGRLTSGVYQVWRVRCEGRLRPVYSLALGFYLEAYAAFWEEVRGNAPLSSDAIFQAPPGTYALWGTCQLIKQVWSKQDTDKGHEHTKR